MIWLGISMVFLLVFVVAWWLTRPRPKCPDCGSYRVGLTSKKPQGMRTFDYHPGGDGGGGYTTVQLVCEVTYRCDQCQTTWRKTITESR
jgi:hypothetical protein